MMKVICFCCFKDNIYNLTVNQDGVGERSESGVKAGKRKLYSVQFSRRGRLRRAWLWEPERADDESHLLFVVLAIYIDWLLIKMELVNGRKLFNLSVSYADSSLYQREPCCSFGLKC